MVAAFLNGKCRQSHQNLKALQVERVQNITLWSSYAAKRHAMLQRHGHPQPREVLALSWHRRRHRTQDRAARLQPKFRLQGDQPKRPQYGKSSKSVYVAVSSPYSSSHRYSRPDSAGDQQQMLSCRMLLGEYCQGNQEQATPDVRHGTDLYDSRLTMLASPRSLSSGVHSASQSLFKTRN